MVGCFPHEMKSADVKKNTGFSLDRIADRSSLALRFRELVSRSIKRTLRPKCIIFSNKSTVKRNMVIGNHECYTNGLTYV